MTFFCGHKWEYCSGKFFIYFQTKPTVRDRFYGLNVGRIPVTLTDVETVCPRIDDVTECWELGWTYGELVLFWIPRKTRCVLFCIKQWRARTNRNRNSRGLQTKRYKSIKCNMWKLCFSRNKFLSYILYLPRYIGT